MHSANTYISAALILPVKVSGSQTLPLGDEQYTYPVVTAEAVQPCGTDGVVAVLRKAGARSPVSVKGPFCNESEEARSAPPANQPIEKMNLNTVVGYWTCTMHPQVHQAEPGNCPLCGMKLVFHRSDKDTTQMRSAEQGR